MSGGIPLTVEWQQYGNPTPYGSFVDYANENAVYGTVNTPGQIDVSSPVGIWHSSLILIMFFFCLD